MDNVLANSLMTAILHQVILKISGVCNALGWFGISNYLGRIQVRCHS